MSAQYLYDPAGRRREKQITGGIACAGGEPFKYTGQRFDPETGLYYYRARYYSPLLGFRREIAPLRDLLSASILQTDPIGYTDDLNW